MTRVEIRGAGDAAVRREYEGVVVDVGKQGVKVRFDDPKHGTLWVPNSQVRLVSDAKSDRPARVMVQAPTPAPLRAVPAPAPPPPPPAPEGPRPRLDQELDALFDMAQAMLSRCEVDVEQATRAVREAEEQLRDAQAVLEELTARRDRAARMVTAARTEDA
ncbi:MAG: hypothetical protein ACRCSL_04635 [Microbacterium sp.]